MQSVCALIVKVLFIPNNIPISPKYDPSLSIAPTYSSSSPVNTSTDPYTTRNIFSDASPLYIIVWPFNAINGLPYLNNSGIKPGEPVLKILTFGIIDLFALIEISN